MAVLLLDWDFHTNGDDDPEYNKKAAAANEFASKAGRERRKLAKSTWAVLTSQTPAEVYADFKRVVLANVGAATFVGEDRVNVTHLRRPFAGFMLDEVREWLRANLQE
jgi:hypothetical protein